MKEQQLKKYAEIKEQIKLLEEQAKVLNDAIVDEMLGSDMTKATFEFGTFTICSKKSYTYSPKIKTMEENLKIAKNKEVEQGKAKVKESKYLLYSNKTNETPNA